MTVVSTTSRAQYDTNGTTGPWTVPFYFLANNHLLVTHTAADGVETTLGLGPDYSVSGAGNPAGGAVTTAEAFPANGLITIARAVPITQETDYTDQDAFPAESHERALDKLTMIALGHDEILGRALMLPFSDAPGGATLPSTVQRQDRLLAFDPLTGNPLASNFTHTQLASLVAAGYSGAAGPLDALSFLADGLGAVSRSPQEKLRETVVSITDFGASAGAPDNAVAFARAEAATAKQIYVPAGFWNTSSTTLGKVYYGPGKVVRTGGAKQANRVVHVQAAPAVGNSALLFDGDQSLIDAEHFRIPATTQVSTVTSPYFNNTLTPHLLSVEAFAGYSGMSTKVNGNSSAGQTGLIVRSTAGIVAGQTLVVGDGTPRREVLTVDVVVSGTLLAMTTNLLYTHTAAQADLVAKGNRTHFEGYRTHMDADGGGDAYAYSARVSVGAAGLANNPNQTHFSYVGTAGIIDGDVTATASGCYLQFSEANLVGSNYLGDHDVAAVGDVRSYQRNNDTGARGAVWIGNLQKSEGTKYCNAAYSVLGKWLGGLDLINADFGTLQAAIKLAPNQRIYFDGSSMADEAGYNLWGANAGDTYITYSAGGSQLQFVVDGTLVASISNAAFFTNTARNINAGGNVTVAQGNRVVLNGPTGNTYLTYDGTHVYLVTNGGTPKQLD